MRIYAAPTINIDMAPMLGVMLMKTPAYKVVVFGFAVFAVGFIWAEVPTEIERLRAALFPNAAPKA